MIWDCIIRELRHKNKKRFPGDWGQPLSYVLDETVELGLFRKIPRNRIERVKIIIYVFKPIIYFKETFIHFVGLAGNKGGDVRVAISGKTAATIAAANGWEYIFVLL